MLALWLGCLLFGIVFCFLLAVFFVCCIVIVCFPCWWLSGDGVAVVFWMLFRFVGDCCLFCSCMVCVFVVQFGDSS